MLPAPTHGLAVQEIGRAEMHAAVPSSHPLARRRSLAVADLDAFPRLLFLGRRQNAPLYRHLDEALRERGLVAPRYSVPRDTYSGLAQIAAGQACTVLCSWVGGFLQAGVSLRPLRKADRLLVSLGWVSRDPEPDAARAVAQAMQALFTEGSAKDLAP
jgi:DNA-binding transcriptional LysR family regulator